MQGIRRNIIRHQSVRGIASSVLLILAVTLTGCVVRSQLERSLGSQGNADDHMAAALLYQQESQRLEAQAHRYEKQATGIRPLEDPKGIRRAGLLISASANRQHAVEVQTLSAMHHERAQTIKAQQGKE
ncbi:MAG: hypothetical protein ACREJU_20935 [Nitrospiraceae bacterium]